MQRKIESELEAWLGNPDRKPLVLNGARQVGKTYSVLDFAGKMFPKLAYIDFSAQGNACAIFDGDITPRAIVPQLEAITKVDIDPGDTLIFFDEIQACPRALTSLKYFQERAPEYPVIAAGSLLGISLGREEYSYPVGKVDMMSMHPLDFEEFLWALGEISLSELIRASYADDSPLGLHDYAMDLYRRYLLVGGMPEAVESFAGNGNLERVRTVQEGIANAYLADMTKYASPIDSAKILNVWRSIPEQLAKENHKFQYSTIASSARAHQYEAPINWLSAAGLISFCYRVREGRKPLRAYAERDYFKLYLLDVGILSTLQGLDEQDLLPSQDKGSRFRGGIAENYVMQQLVASGLEPYYWGTASKSEVDFIVQLEDETPIPIEVKSGTNVTSRSLEAYRRSYEPPYVIRLSARNFGFEQGIRSIPLYAAYCLG